MLTNYPQAKDLHSRIITITGELPEETRRGRTKNRGDRQIFHLSRFLITQNPNWRFAQRHFEIPDNILFK